MSGGDHSEDAMRLAFEQFMMANANANGIWENHGFHHNIRKKNTKANACLSGEDVQNALSQDMIQHEKMIAALRSLFANLSECHELILRSLDEITKYHLDCLEDFRNVGLEAEFEPSFFEIVWIGGDYEGCHCHVVE